MLCGLKLLPLVGIDPYEDILLKLDGSLRLYVRPSPPGISSRLKYTKITTNYKEAKQIKKLE